MLSFPGDFARVPQALPLEEADALKMIAGLAEQWAIYAPERSAVAFKTLPTDPEEGCEVEVRHAPAHHRAELPLPGLTPPRMHQPGRPFDGALPGHVALRRFGPGVAVGAAGVEALISDALDGLPGRAYCYTTTGDAFVIALNRGGGAATVLVFQPAGAFCAWW